MIKPLAAIILIALPVSPLLCQDEGLKNILAPGAKLEKLADGFLFTEGPTADNRGNVYFTDQPNDRIMIWNEKSGVSVFMQPSGRSNGLALDREGNIWSCADEKTELWRISPDKNIERIAGTFEGRLFNGPNDVWADPDGGIYFTDPFYRRDWWSHKEMPQEKQRVYYLKPDHKTIIIVADDLLQPNGIVGTPDGKKLFVADIRANKTWVFSIMPDGTLSDKKLFCEMGSDGMTIDSRGNIYLSGKGVTVFDNTGRKTGNIAVPESWTSNVCFGGKNRKTLFITASKGFYSIKLKVRGTAG
ncbi:MAG: SMP-30/gluconolactonase/LRE family protein [Bacteroidales bacterium]|jgi:gluconolactonase|nr:SMP-30/gluconolactonase/LRE family protein [Bacteroidales bacterium]